MLRQLITILFLAAFFMQTFSKVLMVADYYTNTATYAKNCENKLRLMLHCNGQCQLAKKLQKEAQKDEQNQERKAEKKSEIFSSQSIICYYPPVIGEISSIYLSAATLGKPIDRPASIFHPPLV
jgi:hypothetical protein